MTTTALRKNIFKWPPMNDDQDGKDLVAARAIQSHPIPSHPVDRAKGKKETDCNRNHFNS
jgi:hypothetical protein